MRGVEVNGAQVLSARLKRGWTQDDLAQQADLDVKTVRKAEQGKRLDMAPLSRLAAALRVDVQSLIQTPESAAELQLHRRDVVLEWNRIWDAADMAGLLALYAEDAVLRLPGGPSIPFGGIHRGHAEIRKVHEMVWAMIHYEPIAANELEFLMNDQAVTLKASKGIYMPSGELIRIPTIQVFTFVGLLISEHQLEFDTLDFATKFPFPSP